MTQPEMLSRTENGPHGRCQATAADHVDGEPVVDPGSPWDGIPAELLDATFAYDSDTAGGCG